MINKIIQLLKCVASVGSTQFTYNDYFGRSFNNTITVVSVLLLFTQNSFSQNEGSTVPTMNEGFESHVPKDSRDSYPFRLSGSHNASISGSNSRNGNKSLKCLIPLSPTVSDPRSEIQHKGGTGSPRVVDREHKINTTRTYGFSFYFAEDFQDFDPVEESLMQWKNLRDTGCDIGFPMFSIRMTKDNLKYNLKHDEKPCTKNPKTIFGNINTDIKKGVWHNFVVEIHYDYRKKGNGYVKLWYKENGQINRKRDLVLNYSGPVGYNDQVGPYLKLGMYKSAWKKKSNRNKSSNAGITKREMFIDDVFIIDGPWESATENQSPTVNAGSDKTIALPKTSVTLNGKANDPDGSIASYKWTKLSGPASFSLKNEHSANLQINDLAKGRYTFRLLVSDNKGATGHDDVNITVKSTPSKSNTAPSISGDVSNATCSAEDGSISLAINGGQAPYTYKWSTEASSKNLNNISSGEYKVTVTDSKGQSTSKSFKVGRTSSRITVNASVKNTDCSKNNGSIQVQASGGTAPYYYEWSNNARTSGISKLAAGHYTLTVKDRNGCSKKFSFEVGTGPGAVKHDVTSKITNASCVGNDGDITLKVNGSDGPYSFVWKHGASGSKLESLEQGKYQVTITDTHGCFMKADYLVNQDPGPSKPVITQSADTLYTSQKANHYQWYKDSTAIAGANHRWLKYGEAGTYSVQISNDNNCTASSDYFFAEHPPIAGSGGQTFTLSQVDYYPNPVLNYLNVDISVNQPAATSIILFDFTGRTMMTRDLGVVQSKASHQISMEQYPPGTYLLRIKANDEIMTRRVIRH